MNSPSLAQRWARFVLLLVSLVGLAACGGGGGGGGRSLTRIEVTPAAASIAAGTTQQYVATAIYSDNTREDVSGSASWVSSDPSRATVSTTGLATGKAAGSTTIAASSGGVTGTAPLTVTAATLRSIAVTAAKPSIAKGQTDAFTATGTYSDNSTQDITNSVAWSSSDPSIATVSNASGSRGLAQGVAPGNATITATQGSLSGSLVLRVTAAVLTQLSVTPKTVSLAKGTGQQYAATAIFSDNSTQDVTAATSWSSSDPTVATIATGNSSAGLAQAVGVGSATISGTYMGLSDTGSLQVTAAALVSIAVTPSTPSIAKGLTQQFTATGTYTDNSTQDLTTTVTWSSGTTAVATISNASGSQGLAQGAGTGQSTITAAQPSGTITGTATLTVTAAVIKSLSITPPSATIAKGTTQQYVATATFSDDSTQDVTTATTWSSSDTTIATISNAAGSQGLASGAGIGDATVTGSYSGATASASLSVSAAQLVSIAVTPSNPSIAKGLSQPFTATGVYTDNSTQDLTTAVTWASSSSSIATISNASGSQGVAQSVAVGSTKITATQSGGSISGTSTLTVTAAALTRIDVSPTSPSVPVGLTQQFSATGIYTDNSKQDLSSSVSWSSSDTTIADISSKGLAQTKKVGGSTITATQSGVSGTASLSVTAATLQSIQVQPTGSNLPAGYYLQYSATGIYSDSSKQDLTKTVTWASSNTSFATIDNSSANKGLAYGVAAGSTNVSATLSGVSGSTALTVNTATLTSITVTPANQSIPLGYTQQYAATGTFSNPSQTLDLTKQVSWSSSSTATITIDQNGLATPVATGNATITANKGGTTGTNGTTPVTVTAAVLQKIVITSKDNATSVPNGLGLQYAAQGSYSDGTSKDITCQVTWSSSDTTVATISNSSTTNTTDCGKATGKKVGATNISAASGSVTGNTLALNVTAATLSSIKIATSDGKSSYAKGLKVQLTATGTYSDASTADITKSVTWASDSAAVSVSNASGTEGKASADAVGSSNLTATQGSVVSPKLAITVTAATPVSLAITPVNPSIQNGTSQQFKATLTYTDATTADVTAATTWSSSTTATATISNASGSQGLATSIAPGTTTIGASNTTAGTTSTASTTLTVLRGALQTITVSPGSVTVPAAYQKQFTAMGYYSDSTSQDITATVSWSTFDSGVATISNASGSQGLLTAQAAGSTTVLAQLSGVSGNATVTVTGETLSSIAVSPATATIASNATQQFTATGTFSGNTTLDLTRQVVWASSNTAAATIDQKGLATAGSSLTGTTTISAAKSNKTGTATLTKTP